MLKVDLYLYIKTNKTIEKKYKFIWWKNRYCANLACACIFDLNFADYYNKYNNPVYNIYDILVMKAQKRIGLD